MQIYAKAADLIAAYDKPSPHWYTLGLTEGKNERISLEESGMKFDGANPDHPFVKQLSALSDAEFKAAVSKLSHDTVKAYVWNKYPAFAEKWDTGAGWFGKKMDGVIQTKEFQHGGYSEGMVRDIVGMIAEKRDQYALLARPLLNPSNELRGNAVNSIVQRMIRDDVWRINRGDSTAREPDLPPKM